MDVGLKFGVMDIFMCVKCFEGFQHYKKQETQIFTGVCHSSNTVFVIRLCMETECLVLVEFVRRTDEGNDGLWLMSVCI